MIHGSDALHNSLASMTASKSECSRVRAGAEHAYVLVERGQGARGLEMIAPASHHLQGHHKLSQEGAQWLRTQGFSRGKGRRDFRCTLPSTTGHVELAGRIEEILHRAYGVTVANLCAQVQHDDRVHPTNEEVVENMRRLASTRDHGDRLRMYNSLVNGTLLVPFSPDANESADGPDAWCELDGDPANPVFGVFTDWAHLRMWSLEITEYQPVHGAEFFEEIVETAAVGLRINPGGDVGGELYRHELDTIVKGIHQWRGHR